MKKYSYSMVAVAIIALLAASCVKDRAYIRKVVPGDTTRDSLITYYNCNVDTLTILSLPTSTSNAGAFMTYGGTRYDTVHFGTTINAVGADTVLSGSSAALRLRNPSGPFVMCFPTTGFRDIVLKYAVERSSKGAALNTVSYTIDGINWINTAIAANPSYTVDTVFSLVTLDFSSDTHCNDNPLFQVKIEFSNAAGTTTGNDRFDNITLWGNKK